MSEATIQVYDRELQDLLTRMMQHSSDLSEPMRDIADVLVAGMELAFDREADPNTGAKWQALHPLTIQERLVNGNWPGKILQRSGHLVSSLTPAHGPDYAEAGTNVIYAAAQNFGAQIKAKPGSALRFGGGLFSSATIPARAFAGIWPEGLDEIMDILGRWAVPE